MLNVCDFIQVFVFTTNHHLKIIALKRSGKDRIMTDMISFIRKCKSVCMVSVFIFLTNTCLQDDGVLS